MPQDARCNGTPGSPGLAGVHFGNRGAGKPLACWAAICSARSPGPDIRSAEPSADRCWRSGTDAGQRELGIDLLVGLTIELSKIDAPIEHRLRQMRRGESSATKADGAQLIVVHSESVAVSAIGCCQQLVKAAWRKPADLLFQNNVDHRGKTSRSTPQRRATKARHHSRQIGILGNQCIDSMGEGFFVEWDGHGKMGLEIE